MKCIKTIGIHFTPTQLLIVQITKSISPRKISNKTSMQRSLGKNTFTVENHLSIAIKDDWINALKQFVKTHQLEGIHTVISPSINSVITKNIKLPENLSEKECEFEIREHIEHYLPDISEKLYFDFTRTQSEMVLMAARQDHIDYLVNVVSSSKLKVKIVDVCQYAVVRSLRLLCLDYPVAVVMDDEIIIFDETQIIGQCRMQNFIEEFILKNIKTWLVLDESQTLTIENKFNIKITPLNSENFQVYHLNIIPFLTAFGLAIRDIPAWMK